MKPGFQFLIGSLRTIAAGTREVDVVQFQFLIGSLRTEPAVDLTFDDAGFNSS